MKTVDLANKIAQKIQKKVKNEYTSKTVKKNAKLMDESEEEAEEANTFKPPEVAVVYTYFHKKNRKFVRMKELTRNAKLVDSNAIRAIISKKNLDNIPMEAPSYKETERDKHHELNDQFNLLLNLKSVSQESPANKQKGAASQVFDHNQSLNLSSQSPLFKKRNMSGCQTSAKKDAKPFFKDN